MAQVYNPNTNSFDYYPDTSSSGSNGPTGAYDNGQFQNQQLNSTITDNNTKNVPAWLQPLLQQQATQAGSLANQQYNSPGQQVAGLTADQQRAMGLAGQMPGVAQQGLNQAGDIYGQVAQYGLNGPTQGQIQGYMNPYQTQVMDASRLRQQQQFSQEQNQLQAQQGQTGSFGGSGSFIAQQELGKNFAQQLSQNEADQLYQGFNNAQTQLHSNMQLAGQTGQQIGQNAMLGQQAGLNDINALYTSGSLLQGNQQQQMNANLTNWNAAQQYPWTNLQNAQNVLTPIANTLGGSYDTKNTNQTSTSLGGSPLNPNPVKPPTQPPQQGPALPPGNGNTNGTPGNTGSGSTGGGGLQGSTTTSPSGQTITSNGDGTYKDQYGNATNSTGGYADGRGGFVDGNGNPIDQWGHATGGTGTGTGTGTGSNTSGSGITQQPDGTYKDQYGNTVTQNGAYSDGSGGYVDGNGNKVDEYGNQISSAGMYSDGSGGYVDGNGNKVDEYGNQISSAGMYSDGNGGYVDGNGNKVDEYGNQISAAGMYSDGNGGWVDANGQPVKEDGTPLLDPGDPNYNQQFGSNADAWKAFMTAIQAASLSGNPYNIQESMFGLPEGYQGSTTYPYSRGGLVGYARGGHVNSVDFNKKYRSPSGAPFSHSQGGMGTGASGGAGMEDGGQVGGWKGGLSAALDSFHQTLAGAFDDSYAKGGLVHGETTQGMEGVRKMRKHWGKAYMAQNPANAGLLRPAYSQGGLVDHYGFGGMANGQMEGMGQQGPVNAMPMGQPTAPMQMTPPNPMGTGGVGQRTNTQPGGSIHAMP